MILVMLDEKVTDQDKQALQVWEVVNQRKKWLRLPRVLSVTGGWQAPRISWSKLGDEESYASGGSD